ncbi:hypoxanthine-guanine phosphoribosyltransferase [Lysobacter sp. OAE881]
MDTIANTHDLAAALANSDLLLDRATLEQAIARMARQIDADYTAADVPVYLTVMHGGMPFAAQLAMELGALGQDLEFDYLHATRYRGETSGGELVWKHRPATPLKNRRVLLADDILDEGHTLAAIRDWCLEAGRARRAHRRTGGEKARPLRRRHLRRLRRRRRAGSLRLRLRHGLPRAGPQPAGDLCAEGLNR